MRTRERTRLGLTAMAVMALAAAAGGGGVAANGDAGAPVTLKLGSFNGDGTPTGDGGTDFISRVASTSNGNVTIDAEWGVAPDDPAATLDGNLVARLKDGTFDMILLGARFWDDAGVKSFDALEAPFLITSDPLMEAVATDPDITGPMLDGLKAVGAVGLALWPESLRHPTSFGDPLRSAGDFQGKTILGVPAPIADAMIRALGATPSGLSGSARDSAIESHAVNGIDFTYRWLQCCTPGAIPGSTTTGNVTPYAGYNVLAISQAAWDGLSPAQQTILSDAAAGTLAQLVSANPTDATDATDYCATGGRVVLATNADITSLEQATATVTTQLRGDPQTAAMIDAIAGLKGQVPAGEAATPCGSEAAQPMASPASSIIPATLPPSGTYRAETTVQELIDAGATAGYAAFNAGVITLTIKDDTWTWQWAKDLSTCVARLSVAGDSVHLRTLSGCEGNLEFRWQLQDGGLKIEAVRLDIPADRALFDHVWAQVH